MVTKKLRGYRTEIRRLEQIIENQGNEIVGLEEEIRANQTSGPVGDLMRRLASSKSKFAKEARDILQPDKIQELE